MITCFTRRVVIVFGAAMLSVAWPAWSADYYVDQRHPQASDNNPGTEALPWATMYRAARASLQPGDTVYVKAGTYDASQGGNWYTPSINPASSGAPGNPITFKSLPAHAAVLDSSGAPGVPAIGSYMRSHIVIDGFVIPNSGSKGIAVFGEEGAPARDVVIKNNVIHGIFVDGFDNTEGVRVERAEGVIVTNNRIYNVNNGGGSSNASAVKTYKTRNVVIEHNEFYDVVAGVKEKEASSYLTVRYNRIHDCRYGFVLNNQNTGVTEQIKYYGNIVECGTGFESSTQSTATMRDVHIYNNTFAGYSSKAVHINEHGQGFHIYNNIFYRPASTIDMADFFTRQANTSQVTLMDNNLYLRDPKVVVGLYGENITFNTLAAWKASSYGLDKNSLLADPAFVDVSRRDYHLKAGSPALAAGRNTGAGVVNLGAYARGDETIGLLPIGEGAPPRPPRLMIAQ